MIVFEDGIEEIVNQMPEISGFKPRFHWGNQDELNRYIAIQNQPYPLVWLVGGKESHDLKNSEITRPVMIFFATREKNVNRLNNVRLKENFKKTLIPLVNRFIEGVTKSNRTDFPDRQVEIIKHPNYSGYDEGSRSDSKNKTIDLWDAISVPCRIRMNDKCQNQIKWQNQQ